MSPDAPRPSRMRTAWRVMSASGVLLGAVAILLTAFIWRGQTTTTERAVCSLVTYAERQAQTIRGGVPGRRGNPAAAAGLERLADDMRHTGIHCPPRRRLRP